jgi:hypothetical protein
LAHVAGNKKRLLYIQRAFVQYSPKKHNNMIRYKHNDDITMSKKSASTHVKKKEQNQPGYPLFDPSALPTSSASRYLLFPFAWIGIGQLVVVPEAAAPAPRKVEVDTTGDAPVFLGKYTSIEGFFVFLPPPGWLGLVGLE